MRWREFYGEMLVSWDFDGGFFDEAVSPDICWGFP